MKNKRKQKCAAVRYCDIRLIWMYLCLLGFYVGLNYIVWIHLELYKDGGYTHCIHNNSVCKNNPFFIHEFIHKFEEISINSIA